LIEGQVIVAAIPDDDVGLLLGLAQYGLIVDAGIDHAAGPEMRFIFLALLDSNIILIQILE
jgi:hypothetical protein